MNERIKALLNVCGMPNDQLMAIYNDPTQTFYMEQFAELIVKECYEICKGNLITEHDLTYNDGVMDCAIMLKHHFGVE